MKLKCISIFFFISAMAMGQTSEEEYQYVTFGYREQLQKGLDDKEGYYWRPIHQHKFIYEEEKFFGKSAFAGLFDFEALYRKGAAAPCAIVAIYRKRDNMSKKDGTFFCIPHHDSLQNILAKAEEYLEKKVCLPEDAMFNYSIALGRAAMTISAWEK